VDDTFTKSYYYSTENSYVYLPKEDTYATCRGPQFTPCYDRYDKAGKSPFGVTGMAVLVPKTEAPGKPWVFRADRIGRDASPIDLALLAKGFYIVAAPILGGSPVREEWDAVYTNMTNHGFSRKPALEGAGAGAGEAYAWAIENPGQVSCIYGENPVLRSIMSGRRETKPPLDNLGPLAKAGVPILHVCGQLDPWLDRETRVAEKRYQEFGGQMTVIVKPGEGHFPIGPVDPTAVVEFITSNTRAPSN
jgi:pimeloyl-ACP methyl ester carboxylesterase